MNRIAMLLLFLPAFVAAFPYTNPPTLQTEEFVGEICASEDDTAQGVCLGYIAGVANLSDGYCIPEEIDIEDLRNVVVAEVAIGIKTGQAPEVASEAIIAEIRRRWPCDK